MHDPAEGIAREEVHSEHAGKQPTARLFEVPDAHICGLHSIVSSGL